MYQLNEIINPGIVKLNKTPYRCDYRYWFGIYRLYIKINNFQHNNT